MGNAVRMERLGGGLNAPLGARVAQGSARRQQLDQLGHGEAEALVRAPVVLPWWFLIHCQVGDVGADEAEASGESSEDILAG